MEDEAFDVERHVRRVALPAPGGDAELCELVGQMLSEPLDRSRPLWQLTVVEGLARGRTAIVAKMHHALVDGIAAVDVGTVILDPTPEGLDIPPPEPKRAAPSAPAPRGSTSSRGSPPRSSTCRASSRARPCHAHGRPAHLRAPDAQRRRAWWASWRACARRRPTTRLNAEIGRERPLRAGARAGSTTSRRCAAPPARR